jgi:predicted RNA-binding protein Jag
MNPSQRIPEGVETVKAEGKDLARAVAAAAESMGVDEKRVEFKLDLDHFRSSTGTSVSKRTVAIIAWDSPKSDEELEAESGKKPAKKKRTRKNDEDDGGKKRRSRSRKDDDSSSDRDSDSDSDSDDRRSRSRSRSSKNEDGIDPDLEETDASKFALEWFETLIDHMGIEGELKSGGDDERVQIWISAERAGRLIGKRGSTLGAIRHLLGLAVRKKFGDLTIDVDVADNRPDKGKGRDRDRDDRKGGKKRGGRSRSRGGDRSGGSDRNRYPEDKLKALARRAAEKAAEEGKTITINLELNSYDRRIVHLEVAEIDGVESRSEEREDGVKIIQVAPIED